MKIALAGDTMLGRNVAARLTSDPSAALFAAEVVAVAAEADLFIANLECAVSDRGQRWPDPFKPFFFRAPPLAAAALARLGVDCVTLANNHALDFGVEALIDTCHHLVEAGITPVGAGIDEPAARAPATLRCGAVSVGVIGITDHPAEFAAQPDAPGVAYADLRHGCPAWLLDTVRSLDTDIVLVSPHWGPNMVTEPVDHVRSAAQMLRTAGATLIAGHSAHVFHGVTDGLLYDLGDFIDDYATDPVMRNDLGLLFLVTFEHNRPVMLEAIPLAIEHCHTRLADSAERTWIHTRFRQACAGLAAGPGVAAPVEISERDGRLIIEWDCAGATDPQASDQRGDKPAAR